MRAERASFCSVSWASFWSGRKCVSLGEEGRAGSEGWRLLITNRGKGRRVPCGRTLWVVDEGPVYVEADLVLIPMAWEVPPMNLFSGAVVARWETEQHWPYIVVV